LAIEYSALLFIKPEFHTLLDDLLNLTEPVDSYLPASCLALSVEAPMEWESSEEEGRDSGQYLSTNRKGDHSMIVLY